MLLFFFAHNVEREWISFNHSLSLYTIFFLNAQKKEPREMRKENPRSRFCVHLSSHLSWQFHFPLELLRWLLIEPLKIPQKTAKFCPLWISINRIARREIKKEKNMWIRRCFEEGKSQRILLCSLTCSVL